MLSENHRRQKARSQKMETRNKFNEGKTVTNMVDINLTV